MRFRNIFSTRPKDRPGGNSGGNDRTGSSGDTKKYNPAFSHPQSHLGIGPSKSAPSTSRRRLRKPRGMHSRWWIRFRLTLVHLIHVITAGGMRPEISSISNNLPSVPNTNKSKPVKLSSYIVDPSAAYEKKSNWKLTTYTSMKLVIDVVKELLDVFTPLKSVAGGLSAILKHYDVRYAYLAAPCASLTVVELASDGESPNGGVINTPR